MLGPEKCLPFSDDFPDAETYIKSLLEFGTSSQILHTLCGGVHILDFLTREPDLYSVVLPKAWREWFALVPVEDVLDLLMREDLASLSAGDGREETWREFLSPPNTLLEYIRLVRRHLLIRDFVPQETDQPRSKQIFMGMNPKKVHEVDHFARYVDNLASSIEKHTSKAVTHLADFGAGQNYLGRVLASKPYERHIIAIENRAHVVEGAKRLDVSSKVAKKPLVYRNKKAFRAAKKSLGQVPEEQDAVMPPAKPTVDDTLDTDMDEVNQRIAIDEPEDPVDLYVNSGNTNQADDPMPFKKVIEASSTGIGTVQYVQHQIEDGNLSPVIADISNNVGTTLGRSTQIMNAFDTRQKDEKMRQFNSDHPGRDVTEVNGLHQAPIAEPSLMVISLHSCGNLVHHGLRTLTVNPAVHAIALIGCCYNLMTERLGPPTYKTRLRPDHPRLEATASSRDPRGFPMSEKFATYEHRPVPRTDFSQGDNEGDHDSESIQPHTSDARMETGIRLNITARMMAVQAPQNWTQAESSAFFTRHFFRALLQRIFLDKGIVGAPPSHENDLGSSPAGSSWGMTNGDGGGTAPMVIGNLKKSCYESFCSYVRGAVAKLKAGGGHVAQVVEERIDSMTDEEIQGYESKYAERKKELSIVWSLMAFSAGVVEAMILVDRWCWLKEQPGIKHAWVEPVFDYAKSPRNLVVVGIKD